MTFLICANAQANLLLKCSDGLALEACADKSEETLTQMGCEIQTEATECFFGLVDDPNSDQPDVNIPTDTPLCYVKSSNCSHAPDMMFTIRESCHESMIKMTIPKSSDLTNNYWKGIWAPYSRVICKIQN
jgi:hypothetical protein